jgi:lambda repressor-like predicted transcriptional regulator
MTEIQKWMFRGREWSVRELSEEFGFSENLIRTRLGRSWTVEQTVTVKVMSPSASGRAGKRKSWWMRYGN